MLELPPPRKNWINSDKVLSKSFMVETRMCFSSPWLAQVTPFKRHGVELGRKSSFHNKFKSKCPASVNHCRFYEKRYRLVGVGFERDSRFSGILISKLLLQPLGKVKLHHISCRCFHLEWCQKSPVHQAFLGVYSFFVSHKNPKVCCQIHQSATSSNVPSKQGGRRSCSKDNSVL